MHDYPLLRFRSSFGVVAVVDRIILSRKKEKYTQLIKSRIFASETVNRNTKNQETYSGGSRDAPGWR